MTEAPWAGDACSLIDAFRSGQRSPVEELEATLAAVAASELNALSHVDADAALASAASADVTLPFGGLPIAFKQLDPVEGWPATEASLVFRDRLADHDATVVSRLRASGVVPIGQTTASEFGGLNVSVTRLNGVTGNPWDPTRTAGGSSAGSAAAVAGGLLTLATGGDGGGSIRIPAGFCGLVGMKGTFGRIPRGPMTAISPMTVVLGCLARSVRDVARFYDVCTGYDSRDPNSLPKIEGWERNLGAVERHGLRVAIVPTLGVARVRPEVEALVTEAGEALARTVGLKTVDVAVKLPEPSVEWAMSNIASLINELGDRYPDCQGDLTMEIGFALAMASQAYNLKAAAAVEAARTTLNEAMADAFDQCDVIIAATNPDVAFAADATFSNQVGGVTVGLGNTGALTIPANICGNPAISVPAGLVDGLPVGMQLVTRHHDDALLLDLALAVERERPWPLRAPGTPR
jgi:Asp-tRNA(Asn)/Glu-tRNA(Gln) amidotransferase A subunit family amidase